MAQRSDEEQYDLAMVYLQCAAMSISGAAYNLRGFAQEFERVSESYEPTEQQVNAFEYASDRMIRSLGILEEVERCLEQQLQRAATSTEPDPPSSTASVSTAS